MKTMIFTLLTLFSVNVLAENITLLSAYGNENKLRSANVSWLTMERNESRIKIQQSILKLSDENRLDQKDLKIALKNSISTIDALKYVDSNKDKIILASKCNNEINCNSVLYSAYVKKSNSIYLSKKCRR